MSDALLAEEERCFREIEFCFAEGLAQAEQALTKGLRRAQGKSAILANDTTFGYAMATAMRQVLTATYADVVALTAKAVSLGLESIEDELGWCEETVGAKYRGTAVEGVTAARVVSEGLVTEAMSQYGQAATLGLQAFQKDLQQQARLAAQRSEPVEVLQRRLFDSQPARLIGCSGRGVWWRPMSGLQAAARGVAIGLNNAVREAAMQGMNDAASLR